MRNLAVFYLIEIKIKIFSTIWTTIYFWKQLADIIQWYKTIPSCLTSPGVVWTLIGFTVTFGRPDFVVDDHLKQANLLHHRRPTCFVLDVGVGVGLEGCFLGWKRDFIGIPVSFRFWVEKHIQRPTRNKKSTPTTPTTTTTATATTAKTMTTSTTTVTTKMKVNSIVSWNISRMFYLNYSKLCGWLAWSNLSSQNRIPAETKSSTSRVF